MADSPTPTQTPAAGALAVAKQARELWAKQPKSRRAVALLVVVGIAGGVAYTTLSHKVEGWSVAIDGIAPDDQQELFTALNTRGVAARLHEGKVEVKDDDLDQARAIAAAAGLPFAGKGFELFDGNNLGQSSFAEQVNYRRALQGELARSITTLAQVESARVHLAVGKHSVFKDQDVAPSASVALHLHVGQQLASEQVRGIRQLVAASLEGLKPEAVVIVDGHGNMLEAHDPTSSDRADAIEHGVTDRVRMMLEKVVGQGHVSVVASADVDARVVNQTEDFYDKDHAVVRSESRTIEGSDPSAGMPNAGGVAGVRGNLPGSNAGGAGNGSGNGRLSESKNFEISHKVVQTSNPEQTLRRLQVAVLIDEPKGKDGKLVARTAEELDQLKALARQAAGIDDTRGDVLELRQIQFAPAEDADAGATPAVAAEPPFQLPVPAWLLAAAGAVLCVLIAMVALVVRGVRRKRRARRDEIARVPQLAFPTPVAELERVLEARPTLAVEGAAPADAALSLPPGKSVQERVGEVVKADIERAAQVLTAWLAQPSAAQPAAAVKGAK